MPHSQQRNSPEEDNEEVTGPVYSLPPEARASPMAILFFSWLDSLIWTGYKQPVAQDQLPPCPETLNVKNNVERYTLLILYCG